MALAAIGCGSGGGPADFGALPLDCDAYCAQVMSACRGQNQQWSAPSSCTGACPAFAAGKTTDRSGATLGCRLYHAEAAAIDPSGHCPSAGPGGAGVCGANCEGYCAIVGRACATYPSSDACEADCAGYPDSTRYDVSVASGRSVACLVEHAQAAAANPAACDALADGGACR